MDKQKCLALLAALALAGGLTAQQRESSTVERPSIAMMADETIEQAIQTLEEKLDVPEFKTNPGGVLSMPIYRVGGAMLKGGMLTPAQEKQLVGYLEDLKQRIPTEAGRLDRHIFQIQNLTIGKTAPDIVGEDLDEVPFKLSDYRGKVVVLDFWGDW